MKKDIQKVTSVLTGVTAFFDVLGYKQLLTNNEVEDADEIIRKMHRICSETIWRMERIYRCLLGAGRISACVFAVFAVAVSLFSACWRNCFPARCASILRQ